MQERGSFPHELQTKQLEGKEAGVDGTADRPPTLELREREDERQTQARSRASAVQASFLPQESAPSKLHWGLPRPSESCPVPKALLPLPEPPAQA